MPLKTLVPHWGEAYPATRFAGGEDEYPWKENSFVTTRLQGNGPDPIKIKRRRSAREKGVDLLAPQRKRSFS